MPKSDHRDSILEPIIAGTHSERGDESILSYIATALTWPADTPDGWAIKFANPQDYLDILHNFERLPSLDDGVQGCLDRLG